MENTLVTYQVVRNEGNVYNISVSRIFTDVRHAQNSLAEAQAEFPNARIVTQTIWDVNAQAKEHHEVLKAQDAMLDGM
jgi:hypothetical protein